MKILPNSHRHCSVLLVLLFLFVVSATFARADGARPPDPFPVDTDRDGLEDDLERKLGTSPTQADTDGDLLSDYEEHCKYRTDPTKPDSDGDGTPDGDGDERREYTYTVRAQCEIRAPNHVQWMKDAFQDVRRLDRKPLVDDAQVIELILGGKLFVKVYATACWNNLYPDRTPEEWTNENRDFRTLDVSDQYARHKGDPLKIDLVVKDEEIGHHTTSDGKTMKITTQHQKSS